MLNAFVTPLGHFPFELESGVQRIMDSYREHPSDFELSSDERPAGGAVAMEIGNDERRMHVRAYNYWVSLLHGRDFPSIEDLDPGEVEDFAENSVLLDFTCGRDNPAIPYVGAAIREEGALDDDMRTISEVPSRSLLSRLTDHYMQIIANRSPVGFEAEFDNPHGESICYRGILMPFSSDGEMIDFIYGVINWKRVDGVSSITAPRIVPAEPERIELAGLADLDVETIFETETEPESAEVEPLELMDAVEPDDEEFETDATSSDEVRAVAEAEVPTDPHNVEVAEQERDHSADAAPHVHFSFEDGPLDDEEGMVLPEFGLDENAALADRLWAARETAESAKAGEGSTRAALYKALSLAYDFAVAAQENPDEYAELLEESGVKAQVRAPMTPVVKLVFGIDYDKARLTEFAAALSYAQRQQVELGGFQDLIEKQPGGLKALVAAERQARRPESKTDTKSDVARARLRSAPTISLADVPAEDEFAVVVTRRGPDGTHEPVAIVEDEALLERAIRRTL